jgi:hypothetical protein
MPRHTHKHTTQRPDAVEVRAAMDAVLRATSAACTLFRATAMPHVPVECRRDAWLARCVVHAATHKGYASTPAVGALERTVT